MTPIFTDRKLTSDLKHFGMHIIYEIYKNIFPLS
jgi:hypothetical protein